MPEFGNPFYRLTSGRKLTGSEIVRALRLMIADEYRAIELCEELAESSDSEMAVDVLKGLIYDKRVQVGEFLRLLEELSPEEEQLYKVGAGEVEDEIGNHIAI